MTSETALITGATSGIGAEFARQLAAQGCNLVLVGRREEQLRALAAELAQQHGITADVLLAELATEAGVAAVEAKIAALPRLDMLVNNAGFGFEGTFAQTDIQPHLDMIHVHILATVRLTHAALPGMLKRKAGAVINVSSVAAYLPYPGGATTYNATKAYLNMFSRALSAELHASGVKVMVLCPGFTLSEFHDRPGLESFNRADYPRFIWLSAQQVVSTALRDLRRGKVVCVPGWMYQLLAAFGDSPLTGWLIRRFNRP